MRSFARTLLLVAVATLAVIACTTTTASNGAGTGCSEDSDCESGLRCVMGRGQPGGGCLFPTIGQCSKACTADSDCASLKAPEGKSGFSCDDECKNGGTETKKFCAVR